MECAAAVALAIFLAHFLGTSHMDWAAFASYMVMRGRVEETLTRSILRIIGTMVGGGAALLLMPIAAGHWIAHAILMFMIGTISIYGALTTKRSYAWLFFGLTFAMVALDQIEQPHLALKAFVHTRVLETFAGTISCVVISVVSALSFRRWWPAIRTAEPVVVLWHPHAARHALQAGVALASLIALFHYFKLPELSQSAITIMAVMIIPVTGIGVSGFIPVSRRVLQRFVGCILGAIYAFTILLAVGDHTFGLLAGTLIGVILGRHIENGDHPRRYIGTQFTLAVLVVLVPESYSHVTIEPAVERLSGILIGMAILEPVLLIWHVLSTLPNHWLKRRDSSN